MSLSRHLPLNYDQTRLVAFCQKWSIVEFSFFGSVLRDDFRPDSDVDVLVTFAPDAKWSLFDLALMEHELAGIFGRDVDMVERASVERSENHIRRNAVLGDLEPVYVKG